MTLHRNRLHFSSFRRVILPAAAVAAGLTLTACGGATEASGDVRMGPADGDAIKVVARDNEFEPTTLELEPGSEVTVEVTNDGNQAHNLVIDDLGLSTGTIESGEVATATFTVPDASVTFYCSFHPGMKGEIQPTSG